MNPPNKAQSSRVLKRLALFAGAMALLVAVPLAVIVINDQLRPIATPAFAQPDSSFPPDFAVRKDASGSDTEAALTVTTIAASPCSVAPEALAAIPTWSEFSARYRISGDYGKRPDWQRRDAQRLTAAMDELTSNLLVLAREAKTAGVDHALRERIARNQHDFLQTFLEWYRCYVGDPDEPHDDKPCKTYYLARRKIEDGILLASCVTERDYQDAAWMCNFDEWLGGENRWDEVVYYARKGGWQGRLWLGGVSCVATIQSTINAWHGPQAAKPSD